MEVHPRILSKSQKIAKEAPNQVLKPREYPSLLSEIHALPRFDLVHKPIFVHLFPKPLFVLEEMQLIQSFKTYFRKFPEGALSVLEYWVAYW